MVSCTASRKARSEPGGTARHRRVGQLGAAKRVQLDIFKGNVEVSGALVEVEVEVESLPRFLACQDVQSMTARNSTRLGAFEAGASLGRDNTDNTDNTNHHGPSHHDPRHSARNHGSSKDSRR